MFFSGEMEEDVRHKLREIFDVCDETNEGFITVEHFKNLAKEHFGTESDGQVCDYVKAQKASSVYSF